MILKPSYCLPFTNRGLFTTLLQTLNTKAIQLWSVYKWCFLTVSVVQKLVHNSTSAHFWPLHMLRSWWILYPDNQQQC